MKKPARVQLIEPEKENANVYLIGEKENLSFVSTGCQMLNNILGGGYPLGRMANIIGDKSTAKTALATEAVINMLRQYPDGRVKYVETEAAFDKAYAEAMGMPIDQVDFGDPENPINTVELLDKEMRAFIANQQGRPGLFVVDSLDAISDDAEMKRELTDGSYGMNKQKQLGIIFRKLVQPLEASKVLLLIVSQVRENIGGGPFAEKYKRSGGKAMDFYASQFLWLQHVKTLKKTVNKVENAVGISIRAKCKKNKVGLPFRECDFDFLFGFGIDDVGASLDWLAEVHRLDAVNVTATGLKEYKKDLERMADDDYDAECAAIAAASKKVWAEVQKTFLPKRAKYR